MNKADELEILLRRIYALEHNFKGIRTEVRLMKGDLEKIMEYLHKGNA